MDNVGFSLSPNYQNIIRMIKSRRMRCRGHLARMGRREIHAGVWWERHKERGQ
jgi:hypothetical protein